MMHINPDHFLQTPEGRVVTPERNALAWKECFATLETELSRTGKLAKVFVLVGPQGAGKSTWARSHSAEDSGSIIFDAILVKRVERRPILEAARRHRVGVVAVWFKTSVADCIARNAARSHDEFVAEQAIRNVHAALEPPSIDEGFESVWVVHVDAEALDPRCRDFRRPFAAAECHALRTPKSSVARHRARPNGVSRRAAHPHRQFDQPPHDPGSARADTR